MSRPSRGDARRLEALEGIAGLLAQALDAADVLAIRLRQVERRAPELGALIGPAREELALVVGRCDRAQELVRAILAEDQVDRNSAGG